MDVTRLEPEMGRVAAGNGAGRVRRGLSLSGGSRLDEVAGRFAELLDALGVDRTDPHLSETPRRVAKAFGELLAGLDPRRAPDLRVFPTESGHHDLVTVADIPFYSLCAHHFLPFFGRAHIGYVPEARLAGLSKLARAVDWMARRPQVQERLADQIADVLEERLEPRGVIVVLEARHLCMEMRGVSLPGVVTTTRAARGALVREDWQRRFEAARRGAAAHTGRSV